MPFYLNFTCTSPILTFFVTTVLYSFCTIKLHISITILLLIFLQSFGVCKLIIIWDKCISSFACSQNKAYLKTKKMFK